MSKTGTGRQGLSFQEQQKVNDLRSKRLANEGHIGKIDLVLDLVESCIGELEESSRFGCWCLLEGPLSMMDAQEGVGCATAARELGELSKALEKVQSILDHISSGITSENCLSEFYRKKLYGDFLENHRGLILPGQVPESFYAPVPAFHGVLGFWRSVSNEAQEYLKSYKGHRIVPERDLVAALIRIFEAHTGHTARQGKGFHEQFWKLVEAVFDILGQPIAGIDQDSMRRKVQGWMVEAEKMQRSFPETKSEN